MTDPLQSILLPGVLEHFNIEMSLQGKHTLIEINAGLGSQQRVEKNTLLCRRERVYGFNKIVLGGSGGKHINYSIMPWSSATKSSNSC